MADDFERNLGEQPIARILQELGLKPHQLVEASATPMTHKMVNRACKGRWLTAHTKNIVLAALNKASGRTFTLPELFNY